MPKQSIETRAGIPGRFTFNGKTYRVGPSSAAQHFELMALLRTLVTNPVVQAARMLKEIGDALTSAERSEILADARKAATPEYRSRVRVFWDPEDETEASSLEGLEPGDLDALRLKPRRDAEGVESPATAGDLAEVAWRRGLRPDIDRTKAEASPAETRVRDALNEHFADEAQEVTEQVSGWPPAMTSTEAQMALYSGPGLAESMAILLPPHNPGMTPDEARRLGQELLADPTGEGMKAFNAAFDPAPEGEPDDEADKSGGADAPLG